MKVISVFLAFIVLVSCQESKEVQLQRFLLKGNGLLKEQNTEEATRYFLEAINLDPCYADALNNLGTIAFSRKDWEGALAYYNRALACRADFVGAMINRANTFYERGEYYSALKDIDNLKKLKNDTAVVWFLDGLVRTKLHDYDAALASFNTAVGMDSLNVELLVNRGTIHYYRREWELAIKDLHVARRVNSREPNIYNTMAMIAGAQEKPDLALMYADTALQLAPDQPYFLNNRGYFKLLGNNVNEGLLDINRSIELDPENGWAYRNKGLYYLMNNQPDDALRMFDRAFDLDPFTERIHFYRGLALLKLDRKKEACEAFNDSEKSGDKMVTVEMLKACR